MDTREHAKQIFSLYLMTFRLKDQPLPNVNELPRWAETALIHAKIFSETAEKFGK